MAITFCYAPPPLQDLYGKEGFPPSPSINQSQVGSACLSCCGWWHFGPSGHCLVNSDAHYTGSRHLKQGCVVTSQVTKR